MKNKGLIILTSAVALVVGYAVYDFQSEKSAEKTKAEQATLLKMDKDQINDFVIQRLDEAPLHLSRDGDGWKIQEPVKENADQGATQDFVEATTLEKSKDVAKEGADIDLKLFGFDPPKAKITFKNNSDQSKTFLISTKKNYSGDPYVKIDGENKIFVGAGTWTARAEKKAFDFQDKRFMRFAAAKVNKVKLTRGKESLLVEKKDSIWFSPSRVDWKLDQTKSSEITYMLNNVTALEFIKDSDLKKYGLQKPTMSIEVGLMLTDEESKKTKSIWNADFGINDKKDHYVKNSDGLILKISPQDFEKFLKLDLEGLRDRKEAFHFSKDDIKKAEITLPEIQGQFELQDGNWKNLKEDSSLEVKPENIRALISQLRNFELFDFETHKSLSEFESMTPKSRFLFKNSSGQMIFQLDVSSSYKKKIDGVEKTLIYAKTNLYPSVIGLDESHMNALNLKDLMKKKEDNKVKPQ